MILISWGYLTSPTFIFAMSYFNWSIAKRSCNYGKFAKIEDSIERWRASPFGPPI